MVGSPVSSRNNKDDSACDAHFEAGPLRTASRRGSINLGTPFINKGETGLLKMLRFWERNPYEATPGRCTAPRRCVARRGLRQPTVRMWQSSNQSLTPHPAKPPWFVKTAVRPRSGPPAHPFEQSVRSRFPPAHIYPASNVSSAVLPWRYRPPPSLQAPLLPLLCPPPPLFSVAAATASGSAS